MEKRLWARKSIHDTTVRARRASEASPQITYDVRPMTMAFELPEQMTNLPEVDFDQDLKRWTEVLPFMPLKDQLLTGLTSHRMHSILHEYFANGHPMIIDDHFLLAFPLAKRREIYVNLGSMAVNVIMRDISNSKAPRQMLSRCTGLESLSFERIQFAEFKEIPQHYVKKLSLVDCSIGIALLNNWLFNLGHHLTTLHIEDVTATSLTILNPNLQSLTLIGSSFQVTGAFLRLEHLKVVSKQFDWRGFVLGKRLKQVYCDAPARPFPELASMESLTVRWWHGLEAILTGPPQRFSPRTRITVLSPVFPAFKAEMDRLRRQCIVKAVDYVL